MVVENASVREQEERVLRIERCLPCDIASEIVDCRLSWDVKAKVCACVPRRQQFQVFGGFYCDEDFPVEVFN